MSSPLGRRPAALRPVRARPRRLPLPRLARGRRCRRTPSTPACWAGRCATPRPSRCVVGEAGAGHPGGRPGGLAGGARRLAAGHLHGEPPTCPRRPRRATRCCAGSCAAWCRSGSTSCGSSATEVAPLPVPGGAAPAAAGLRRRAAPRAARGRLRGPRRAPRPHHERQPGAALGARAVPSTGGDGGFSALVLVEHEGYTLIFARGGEPVLHRYKAFTGIAARGPADGLRRRAT